MNGRKTGYMILFITIVIAVVMVGLYIIGKTTGDQIITATFIFSAMCVLGYLSMRKRPLDARALALVGIFGALGFVARKVFVFTIYPPLVLDPRWVFSLLVAIWAGPAGGAMVGGIVGLASATGLDVVAGSITHLVLGAVSKMKIKGKTLTYKAVILWPLIGTPAWILQLLIFTGPAILKIVDKLALTLIGIGIVTGAIALVIAFYIETKHKGLLLQYGLLER
ncbi:MAG: hypothetical protein H3Z52_07230 [archaeon]|nr:hypothetical protein [archaeon]MCP8315611.1 hypothetical protein [archaeon]MCP8320717.1 hypothetical protein [archaeon]